MKHGNCDADGPPIETSHVLRVGLRFQLRVNRRLVEPQPLRNGGATNAHLLGRVQHEAHTRRNSSRTLPGLRQRIRSPVEEKRLCGVFSPLRTFHQSLPVRRMLRAPLSFSFCKRCAAPYSAAAEARLLGLCAASSVTELMGWPFGERG